MLGSPLYSYKSLVPMCGCLKLSVYTGNINIFVVVELVIALTFFKPLLILMLFIFRVCQIMTIKIV